MIPTNELRFVESLIGRCLGRTIGLLCCLCGIVAIANLI